jgi:hypothetical protein
MKKVSLVFVVILFLATGFVNAQTASKDYFVGKWSVLAVGTPGGNSKMVVDLKRVNGKLEGKILREDKDPVEISKVEETPTSIKVYFRHLFYKVTLQLTKKDDVHTDGILMGKYKSTGVRLK